MWEVSNRKMACQDMSLRGPYVSISTTGVLYKKGLDRSRDLGIEKP